MFENIRSEEFWNQAEQKKEFKILNLLWNI